MRTAALKIGFAWRYTTLASFGADQLKKTNERVSPLLRKFSQEREDLSAITVQEDKFR